MSRIVNLKSRVRQWSPVRVAQLGDAGWRTSQQTTAERGYGSRWQKARRRFLQQYPLCVMCETAGRVSAATVVDHIVPHRGDQQKFWDVSNWQALCAFCHSGEKQRQERQAQQDEWAKPVTRSEP